jgi:hypothetical protein
MVPKKWCVRSLTFWFNLLLALLMYQFDVQGLVGELIRELGLEGVKEYVITLIPTSNILLRFVSWNQIGVKLRHPLKSKTVILNSLILAGSIVLFYLRVRDGQNLWTPVILGIVAMVNIYLRVNRTKEKITLLPWPFNFI